MNQVKLFLFGLTLFTVVGYISCAGAASQVPRHVVIYFSTGTSNELFLCGCVEQLGGLARRKTAIDKCEYPNVVVDVGGFSKSSARVEIMKTETLLKAYNAMNYAVINLGNVENRLGRELIEQFAEISDAPFISANIADENGNLIFAPYRVISVQGLRIGFVGVTSSAFIRDEVREGFKVLDLENQVAKYVPEVRNKSDLVVVLAHARDTEIEKIASSVQGIDAVLGGLAFQYSTHNRPTKVAGTIVHKNGELGRYIGRLRLDLQTSKPVRITNYEGFNMPLPEKMVEDEEILEILAEYRRKLMTTDFTQTSEHSNDEPPKGMEDSIQFANTDNTFSDPSTYLSYTSALKCAECHADIYREWRKTRHANAFQTLLREGEDKNDQCLRCHTVGYKRIGGFVSYESTPNLIGVQCESCHGGGARHVLAMENPDIRGPAITSIVPEVFCLRCHTEEWSPGFSMSEKLPLVNHGKNIPATETGLDNNNTVENLLKSEKE